MTRYIPRSEWNDRGNPPGGYGMGTVGQIVFHHTPGQDGGGDYNQALYEVRRIRNGHMDSNGWADIGYTFLVSGDMVFEGRGFGYTGAHAPGANSNSIGIAFILDGRYREPTPQEWASARWICDQAVTQGWLAPGFAVTGHRDHVSTECPAALVYNNRMKVLSADSSPSTGGGIGGGPDLDADERKVLFDMGTILNVPATGWKFDNGQPITTLPEFLFHLHVQMMRKLDRVVDAVNQDLNIEATGWKYPDGRPASTLPEFIHLATSMQASKIDQLVAAVTKLADAVANQQPANDGVAEVDVDKLLDRLAERLGSKPRATRMSPPAIQPGTE